MKLINFLDDVFSPRFIFTRDMLEFDKVDADSEFIIIPFSGKAFCEETFNVVIDVCQQRMRDTNLPEHFEESIISGEYYLSIWNNHNGTCIYQIQFLTNDGDDAFIRVDLSDNELKIIQPIIDNEFGEKKVVA